ncbi:hypothetical protein CDG81_04430 [Actinopolyspora erythraea]|uniref:Uncharacterized protein n=1 Tax=Actinopolyspora erythraea TaxID=414996 RepID=A0A223RP77_9ACTN|nr:hypothetical protein CDG81_04430 [Actinopolyspora erythraea]
MARKRIVGPAPVFRRASSSSSCPMEPRTARLPSSCETTLRTSMLVAYMDGFRNSSGESELADRDEHLTAGVARQAGDSPLVPVVVLNVQK